MYQNSSKLIDRLFYRQINQNDIVSEDIIKKSESNSQKYLDETYYLPNSIKFINSALKKSNINLELDLFRSDIGAFLNTKPINKMKSFTYFSPSKNIFNDNCDFNNSKVLYRVRINNNNLISTLINIFENSLYSPKSIIYNNIINNLNSNLNKKQCINILDNNQTELNYDEIKLYLENIIETVYNKLDKINIAFLITEENKYNFIIKQKFLLSDPIYLIHVIIDDENSKYKIYFDNILFVDLSSKTASFKITDNEFIKYLLDCYEIKYLHIKKDNINPLILSNLNINEIEFDPNDRNQELPVIEINVNGKPKRFLLGKTNNLYEDDNHLNNLVGKLKFIDDTYSRATVYWSENYLS